MGNTRTTMRICMGTGKKNNLSILFVVNALYAGAGKIVLYVARECVRTGWDVTVATFYDNSIGKYHIDGVNFINLDIPTNSRLWRINALHVIRNAVASLHPMMVCSFVSDVAVMTRIATLGLKIRFIAAERGDPYTLPPKWVKPVKWAYAKSDFTVFQLKGAQDFFGDKIRRKSTIIPNPYSTGEDISPFEGVRKNTVVSVGRFVEQKGYDVLIKAFARFQQNHQNYKLVLYGDGPLKEELVRLSEKLDISDKVLFPGFIHNVTQRIREDGMFVLSSRFEGIPNALIEAMATGIPTVSTDCSPGGPRFLTDNGRRGALVPVDNIEKIAEEMSLIADDFERAAKFSALGLEIKSVLDPNTIAQSWINVFENTEHQRYAKHQQRCSWSWK